MKKKDYPVYMIMDDWNADIETDRIRRVYGFKTNDEVYRFVGNKRVQGYAFNKREPGEPKKLTQSEEITAGAILQGGVNDGQETPIRGIKKNS